MLEQRVSRDMPSRKAKRVHLQRQLQRTRQPARRQGLWVMILPPHLLHLTAQLQVLLETRKYLQSRVIVNGSNLILATAMKRVSMRHPLFVAVQCLGEGAYQKKWMMALILKRSSAVSSTCSCLAKTKSLSTCL